MHNRSRSFCLLVATSLIGLVRLQAAGSDVLILNDDEKLIGHFVRSNGGSVVFKSDVLGDVTVDWSKIKELHAVGSYSVVVKDVKLGRRVDPSRIPSGPVEMSGQTITLTPAGAPPQRIAVADASHVIDQATLDKEILHHVGILHDWGGSVTGGATLVEATQQSRTFTGAINLVRAVPNEGWLPPRDRTIVGFSVSDGFTTQPGTPRLKTSIVHAGLERDEYVDGGGLYGFGQAAFDHNYSQGLDLQQTYGAGIGWTAIKRANESFDLTGSVDYVRQQFSAAAATQSLVGSIFAERYHRTLTHGIVFQEGISVTPTWSNETAWSASGTASITIPVYKRFGFTTNLLDSFLNNPPPGFKKNSFQVATGLTYTLR